MERTPTPDILGDVLGPAPTAPKSMAFSLVRSDGGTQMRAGLDQTTVEEYADVMREAMGWGSFPPIVVFYDGSDYWLADGFHRMAAASRVNFHGRGWPIEADVRAGTRRDAILYAAQANANHGLRRTNADKRRAVEMLLRDPEWSQWSNMEIGRRCSVAEKTVRLHRAALTSEIPKSKPDLDTTPFPAMDHNGAPTTAEGQPPVLRRGADGRTINTANIGQRPVTHYAGIWRLQQAVKEVAGGLIADDVPADIVAADLRRCASQRAGETWQLLKRELSASGLDWRVPDLAQAMNNAASGLELHAPVAPPPAPDPRIDEDERHEGWLNYTYDIRPDLREAGWRMYQLPVGTWRCEHPDLGIIVCANTVDATRQMTEKTRSIAMPKPALVAIPAEPELDLRERRLHDAVRNNRIGDFIRLRQVYLAALDTLERFGELTGRATLTLPAKRAIQDLLDVVNAELRDLGA